MTAPARFRVRRLHSIGLALLALSVVSSALALSGRLHPMALRWMAHGGAQRRVTLVLGSLSFKASLFVVAAILAFWPARREGDLKP
jgi:hypothetical protein